MDIQPDWLLAIPHKEKEMKMLGPMTYTGLAAVNTGLAALNAGLSFVSSLSLLAAVFCGLAAITASIISAHTNE